MAGVGVAVASLPMRRPPVSQRCCAAVATEARGPTAACRAWPRPLTARCRPRAAASAASAVGAHGRAGVAAAWWTRAERGERGDDDAGRRCRYTRSAAAGSAIRRVHILLAET